MRRLSACNAQAGTQTGLVKYIPRNPAVKSSSKNLSLISNVMPWVLRLEAMYKGQRMYVVAIDNYAYIVPFVDDENERFLKTIFPSRKYTKIYRSKGGSK